MRIATQTQIQPYVAPKTKVESTQATSASPDSVSISGSAQAPDPARAQAQAQLDKKEMLARYSNNILLHLFLGDGPAVLAIAANFGALPNSLAPLNTAFDTLNTVTSVAAVVADIRELRGTLKNPNATKMDVAMDVGHLVLGDVLATAAGSVPLIMPFHGNLLATGFFVGGQAVGIAVDMAKTVYDFKRKGQQSAHQAL